MATSIDTINADCSTSGRSHRTGVANSNAGPVTNAIRAMRNEPEPPRRSLLRTTGAALVGAIIGAPIYRAGRDLSFVAECWLADAALLGMRFVVGPDGAVWRVAPLGDGEERHEAREHLLLKINNRPSLLRAVRQAVRNGFAPEAVS